MTRRRDENRPILRYVNIPCPSRKHARTIVTFRNHSVAAMFCIPCDQAWSESTAHPELQAIPVDPSP
jgi:hypothetical protein